MEGFDSSQIYFSDNLSETSADHGAINLMKKKFKDFLREFHEGNFNYKYRNALKINYNLQKYFLDINLDDLAAFDESLAEKVNKNPTEYLPIFEDATKEVADEVTAPREEEDKIVKDIQLILTNDANPTHLRNIKSTDVSKIVKIPGIAVAATGIRSKATKIAIKCLSCKVGISNIPIKPGLEGYVLPRKCSSEAVGRPPCPLDPYFIEPDKCKCVDYQIIKLQELPEHIPQGEMPRHVQLYCDRNLCDRITPGNKIIILGVYCIKKVSKPSGRAGSKENSSTGVRAPYIRVLGIKFDGEDKKTSVGPIFTMQEEDEFRRLASQPDVYERIAKSIAPSIFGAEDIKKAVACLLFGGSRKKLPDGLLRRGDINVLMLGDPGTAKSQLLKFVDNVAPIGIYTSGKGSSAAGLTASVNRDPVTRNFIMEGGALVLADGGVVCIDEFDKMREDDRVAIHEAMEQQTISIAKAGITATLNTRCSILAAANSVFGRWDDVKGDENINFMPTILSRFDMIFIVKDEQEATKDATLAKHVLNLHVNAGQITEEHVEGELSLNFFKKYIHYCRKTCGPRLSKDAGDKLKNYYVKMRTDKRDYDNEKRGSIPITVRQLEAIIRISEALAKMKLAKFVSEEDVKEAQRLFSVSTLRAASTGSFAGAEGFTTDADTENLSKIEQALKQRFAVGSCVSVHAIINDFAQKHNYSEHSVQKVIHLMIRRGDLHYRLQKKMLVRTH